MNRILKGIEESYAKEQPFVAFKKPQSKTLQAYFQKDDQLHVVENYGEEGFVFAPFDSHLDSILIPKSQSDYFEEGFEKKSLHGSNHNFTEDLKSKKNHIKLVNEAVHQISSTSLEKVVISRVESVPLDDFMISKSFQYLIHSYNHAFVYVWCHPKVGLWLGATPESLTSVTKNSFSTMALAGTQAFTGDDHQTWGSKEIDEHQIVVDYIASQIEENVQLNELLISDTYTVKAGSLLHLRADISGSADQIDLRRLLQSIHPTPAVCGFPKEMAQEFILTNEGYDRTFYTGYLGELNCDNQTNLFVNLRCMQVTKDYALIYVGGGITKDSIAEKEWDETVLKTQTMKKAIN